MTIAMIMVHHINYIIIPFIVVILPIYPWGVIKNVPSFGLWSLIARHGRLVHPLPDRELAPLVEETVHPFSARHQQGNAGAVQLVEPMEIDAKSIGNRAEVYGKPGESYGKSMGNLWKSGAVRPGEASSHEPSWPTSLLSLVVHIYIYIDIYLIDRLCV
jgi:hypothetical protein